MLRWLVSALATSEFARRSSAPTLYAAREPLATEELQALAGIWATTLDLDDGRLDLNLHLDASGAVHATNEQELPFNICRGEHGWSSARWSCSAVPESANLVLTLQLGVLHFRGKGTRQGLVCSSLAGHVMEGSDDPCCVGSFEMALALPFAQDVAALEERHRLRVDARPPPPLSFRLDGFIGQWCARCT